MRKQLAVVAALALPCAAVPVQAASGGAARTAVNTATYNLVVKGGVVTRLEIHLKTGGLVVADQFTNDKDERATEVVALKDGLCTGACRSTCEYAASARPFRSLVAYDPKGRQLWRWQAGGKIAEARPQAAVDADCVSPNSKYLLVQGHEAPGDAGGDNEMVGVFT